MNRRAFLAGLVATASGLLVPKLPDIVVPERRFWALDRSHLGAPAAPIDVVTDGVFSPDIWAREVLRATEADLVFAKYINRQFEDGADAGRTVKVASIRNLRLTA